MKVFIQRQPWTDVVMKAAEDRDKKRWNLILVNLWSIYISWILKVIFKILLVLTKNEATYVFNLHVKRRYQATEILQKYWATEIKNRLLSYELIGLMQASASPKDCLPWRCLLNYGLSVNKGGKLTKVAMEPFPVL